MKTCTARQGRCGHRSGTLIGRAPQGDCCSCAQPGYCAQKTEYACFSCRRQSIRLVLHWHQQQAVHRSTLDGCSGAAAPLPLPGGPCALQAARSTYADLC